MSCTSWVGTSRAAWREGMTVKQERPRWQIFLTTYAVAFVVSAGFGLLTGQAPAEALVAGLVRALVFGTVMTFVLIGMMKANRTYDEAGSKANADGDPNDVEARH